MKTLKEKAKELGWYTLEDIPKKYLEHPSSQFRIERSKDIVIDPVLNSIPEIECGVFFETCEDTDWEGKKTYYISDSVHVFVKRKDSDVLCQLYTVGGYGAKKAKHAIIVSWAHSRKWHKIGNHKLSDARKKARETEPNMIGVFTPKKVNDWLDHCERYAKIHDELMGEVSDKNAEIEKRIQYIKDKFSEGEIHSSGTSTRIYHKGFRISLSHNTKEAYLDERVEYSDGVDSVIELILNK